MEVPVEPKRVMKPPEENVVDLERRVGKLESKNIKSRFSKCMDCCCEDPSFTCFHLYYLRVVKWLCYVVIFIVLLVLFIIDYAQYSKHEMYNTNHREEVEKTSNEYRRKIGMHVCYGNVNLNVVYMEVMYSKSSLRSGTYISSEDGEEYFCVTYNYDFSHFLVDSEREMDYILYVNSTTNLEDFEATIWVFDEDQTGWTFENITGRGRSITWGYNHLHIHRMIILDYDKPPFYYYCKPILSITPYSSKGYVLERVYNVSLGGKTRCKGVGCYALHTRFNLDVAWDAEIIEYHRKMNRWTVFRRYGSNKSLCALLLYIFILVCCKWCKFPVQSCDFCGKRFVACGGGDDDENVVLHPQIMLESENEMKEKEKEEVVEVEIQLENQKRSDPKNVGENNDDNSTGVDQEKDDDDDDREENVDDNGDDDTEENEEEKVM